MNACQYKSISKLFYYKRVSFLFLSLLILLLSIPDISFAGVITFDDSPYDTGQHVPMEGFHGDYSYTQQIYLQSEINAAGPGVPITITAIDFYYHGPSSWTDQVVIYMGHTSMSVFTYVDDWVSTGSMTPVYSGSFTVTSTNGWKTITLDTPFEYNNTNNLVIAFDENDADYHASNCEFICSSEGVNRCIYFYTFLFYY